MYHRALCRTCCFYTCLHARDPPHTHVSTRMYTRTHVHTCVHTRTHSLSLSPSSLLTHINFHNRPYPIFAPTFSHCSHAHLCPVTLSPYIIVFPLQLILLVLRCEAKYSSEKKTNFYQTTWHHVPRYEVLYSHQLEIFKSHML
jgi:hypothetical protein